MVMLVIFMMMGALLMGNLVQGYLEDGTQLENPCHSTWYTGHWKAAVVLVQ